MSVHRPTSDNGVMLDNNTESVEETVSNIDDELYQGRQGQLSPKSEAKADQ